MFFTANADEIISQSMDWGGVIGAAIMIMPGIFFRKACHQASESAESGVRGTLSERSVAIAAELKQESEAGKERGFGARRTAAGHLCHASAEICRRKGLYISAGSGAAYQRLAEKIA